jgi:hypothetical protein
MTMKIVQTAQAPDAVGPTRKRLLQTVSSIAPDKSPDSRRHEIG